MTQNDVAEYLNRLRKEGNEDFYSIKDLEKQFPDCRRLWFFINRLTAYRIIETKVEWDKKSKRFVRLFRGKETKV